MLSKNMFPLIIWSEQERESLAHCLLTLMLLYQNMLMHAFRAALMATWLCVLKGAVKGVVTRLLLCKNKGLHKSQCLKKESKQLSM